MHLLSPAVALIAVASVSWAAPAPAAKGFTYFTAPTPLALPCDLTTGPDGAVWGQDIVRSLITRLDVATGVIEEYPIPYGASIGGDLESLVPSAVVLACAIQTGHDGMIYAAAGIKSQFLRINPVTKNITVFTPPYPNSILGNAEPFNDLYAAPDAMYFTLTTANVLFRFDYKTEAFTPYIPPTAAAGPLGVFYASDGNIWITYFTANKIAKFDLATETFIEYALPLPGGLAPAVIRAESPKGTLWATCLGGGSVARFDMATGAVTLVPDFPASAPSENTVDSEGNVWYSTIGRGTLNKIKPATGEVTHVTQPGGLLGLPPVSLDLAIMYGPGNAIWFTELANNRIGRYQL